MKEQLERLIGDAIIEAARYVATAQGMSIGGNVSQGKVREKIDWIADFESLRKMQKAVDLASVYHELFPESKLEYDGGIDGLRRILEKAYDNIATNLGNMKIRSR